MSPKGRPECEMHRSAQREGSPVSIQLDHVIVPARDRVAAAKQLAEILDVPWAAQGFGPFSAVYVNDGLTLDFIETQDPFPIYHFCFRVSDVEFDAIFARLLVAKIPYRSNPHGEVDMRINTDWGGRVVYWTEPENHMWEILTVSYARPRGDDRALETQA